MLGLGGLAFRTPHPDDTTGVTAQEVIAVPSEMFAIGESRWKAQGRKDGGYDYMVCFLTPVNSGVLAFDPARHGKDYNQLFCDGHVGVNKSLGPLQPNEHCRNVELRP